MGCNCTTSCCHVLLLQLFLFYLTNIYLQRTYASVPTTETFKYYDTVSADLDFHNNKMLVVTMPVDTLVGATFFTPTVK